jgi:hypothetical protein
MTMSIIMMTVRIVNRIVMIVMIAMMMTLKL